MNAPRRPSPSVLASLLVSAACLLPTSATPANAQSVGISAAVNQNARGTRPDAGIRTIVIGDNVVYNERIDTDGAGLLQILLADGTTFTVGPNSGLSIDRFVYNPEAGTAEVSATLTKGVFRFIGGKTSKTPGGVSLNTPVGTIGIRGAMADLKIGGSSSHFDLKFGKELTLTNADGTTQRVYQPGYSVVVTTNANGSQKSEIRRTPPSFANEIQQALSGAPGTNGGSPNQPTDGAVLASRISTENSDRPPVVNAPPIPTARPESPGETERRDQDIVEYASTDLTRDTVVEQTSQAPAPSPETPTTTPVTDPAAPAVRSYPVRLITAGATYAQDGGGTVNNPGSVGLIGGSSEEDRVATLGILDGTARASGTTNRGELVLPVLNSSSFTTTSIPLDGQASLGGLPLSGIVYSGEGGFAAYMLGIQGDATRPVFALTGTPTPSTLR